MQKGITKDIVLKEAESLINEKGASGFSVRELAKRLEIKPASLYNHISGIEELFHDLAVISCERMKKTLADAMADKSPDEAFLSGAVAYREYADKNREMYLILIRARSSKDYHTSHLAFSAFSPMRDLIFDYNKDKRERLIFVRSFRAFLHGFVEVTHDGFMQLETVTRDETFKESVQKFLEILKEGTK